MISIQQLLLVSVIGLGLISSRVLAADLTVTCDGSGCDSNPKGASLFAEGDVKPLDQYARVLEACNTSDESLTFAIETSNYVDSSTILGGARDLTKKDSNTGTVLVGPSSLATINQGGYVLVGAVSPNSCRLFDFIVGMSNVGNEYQNKQISFDLNLGFDALSGITPTPTVTPTPTPTMTAAPTPTPAVLGEITTPTPIAPTPTSLTPTPTPLPPTPIATSTPSVLGDQLVNTGAALIIPILAGLFIVSGVILIRRKRRETTN